MDSERLYKSYQSARKFVGTTFRDGQKTGGGLPGFTNHLSGEKETDDSKETAKAPENTTNPMDEAFNRMSTGSARFFSNEKNALETFRKLHELMMRSILDLLFGDMRHPYTEEASQCVAADDTSGFSLDSEDFAEYEMVTTYDHFSYSVEEYESVDFSAKGTVQTDDGRSIDIDLNLHMSRSFKTYYEDTFAGIVGRRFTDPLVVNFNDCPAELKSMDFFFDLDADGEKEKIKTLSENSGYLALDLNGDGLINDGSELFGTKSGDGFHDLSLYDEDHNGWIDENDSIFEKLKIWAKDPSGNDLLFTLKEKNIGAMYLGNADTDFSLNSRADNQTLGAIRKTGLFLYENGTAGTLQHVDLVS